MRKQRIQKVLIMDVYEKSSVEEEIEDVQLQDLCEYNGVSCSRIIEEGLNIQELEMFFTGFPTISGLEYFPNLVKLVVINQTISCIEGVETLKYLDELWICDCKITKIENLDNCKELTKLYLYDNLISEIANLDNQKELQVLWLNGNQISKIQNLDSLPNLQELNLAENKISRIGENLNSNINLTTLNLSGNEIAFFKDINDLCNLPELKHLSFKDPYHRPCPVSQLCNYSSYVLFYLPQLLSLDTYDVTTKEISEIIESLVEKKLIFYNDQIKTLDHERSCWYLAANQLKEFMVLKHHQDMKRIAETIQKIKTISMNERIIKKPKTNPDNDETEESDTEIQTNMEDFNLKIHEKNLMVLQRAFNRSEFYCSRIDTKRLLAIDFIEKRQKRLKNYLQIEMESCGNIRIQKCTKDDPCFVSCCHLVLSQFCASDFWIFNITGAEVENVYKVVNRAIISRFENKMMSLVPESDDDFNFVHKLNELKKHQDYLFWTCNPELPPSMSDMAMIIENGFPPPHSYKKLGLHGGVPLTNSLYLADRWRIKQEVISSNHDNHNKGANCFKYGILLLCRVYLGKTVSAENNKILCQENYKNINAVYKTKATLNEHSEVPDFLGKHSCCLCLQDQQEWYIFNQENIVPEYIIEFKYITVPSTENPFLLVSNCQEEKEFADILSQSLSPLQIEMDEEESIETLIEQFDKTPKAWRFTDSNIMSVINNTPNPELIIHLNFSHQNLEDLILPKNLVSLTRLEVNFNKLKNLNLSTLPLTYINASFNNITTLKGIKNLLCLKYLDVSWNELSNVKDEINILKEHSLLIEELDTRQNPWRKAEDMRLRVIGNLISINILDGCVISEAERDAAESLLTTDLISVSLLETHSRIDICEPTTLSLQNTAQTLTGTSLNTPKKLSETDPISFAQIMSVNLDYCQLSDLSYLGRLTMLKWISVNGNKLTTLSDLNHCGQLLEISASDNCIEEVGNLGRLINLQRLHLGHNFIRSLKLCGLNHLLRLTYLSLENNQIHTLDGFHELLSLCQLYIGHNLISFSKEIIQIKNLKNLMTVDFRNNPMTNEIINYRFYVIYYLKGLQILDGKNVDPSEAVTAKEMFGGRLTTDFINERLGDIEFDRLRELNFPNCTLRTVDLGNGNNYANLTSVNLEHNQLTCLGGLLYLYNLKILCLNNNRIESIFPRHKWGKPKFDPAHGDSEDFSAGDGDISMSRSLLQLQVLHLGYNEIRNLPQLQLHRLPSLKALFLQGNDICRLEGLEGLSNLMELILDANKVKTIPPLAFNGLNSLIELHLEENRLVSLAGLTCLPKLERLYLGHNKIQEISEFDYLCSLTCLSDISLINNPVSKKSQMRYILINNLPQLTAINNIVITVEECIKAEAFFAEQQMRQNNSTTTTTSQTIMVDGGLPCISQCHLQVSCVKPIAIGLCSPTIGIANNPSLAMQEWHDSISTNQLEKSNKTSMSGNRLSSGSTSILPSVNLSKKVPLVVSDHPPEPSYVTLQEFGDSFFKSKDNSSGHH